MCFTKRRAKIKESVKHQGIGGKEILLEKKLSLNEVLEQNTIAAFNFAKRRLDLVSKSDKECAKIICYYGHVGNLGYFVAEDELV